MTGNAAHEDHTRTGVLAALGAYGFWGLLPIYFIILREVPAQEILVARILYAVPFGALIIWTRNQWRDVITGLKNPKVVGLLALSAGIVATNWLIYIMAVQDNHIFEASLGYYINPLMYVAVGVLVLGERLRQAQRIAVILAVIGVGVLTIYGGKFPLISLTLAISFTIYGYVRKRTDIGAMPGLFIETLLLAPIAALYLAYIVSTQDTVMESAGLGLHALLTIAGPATVIPLLFFAIAARRLTLATLGFLQFLGPTIQFIIGLIDGEPFTLAHQICFAFIWVAAAIFAYDAWRRRPVKALADTPAIPAEPQK